MKKRFVVVVIVWSFLPCRAAAEAKPVEAYLQYGANSTVDVYLNGKLAYAGEDTEDAWLKITFPVERLGRTNVIAFKQENIRGAGAWQLFAYHFRVKMDDGSYKDFHANEKKDRVLYTDGSKGPAKDAYGNSWYDFEYEASKQGGWSEKPRLKSMQTRASIIQTPIVGKLRVSCIMVTRNGKALTDNDTYYYRRLFALWGKKVKQSDIKRSKKAAGQTGQDDSAAAQAYFKSGIDYLRAGEFANAIQHIRHALSKDENIDGAWTQLGYCYEETGQMPQAIKAYEKALAMNPNDSYARQHLSALQR